MRLWTFTASTLVEAMNQVRRELGDEASLVSTETVQDSGQVRVVATKFLDEADPDQGTVALEPKAREEHVLAQLVAHGTPLTLASRIAKGAGMMEAQQPVQALAGTLAMDFTFDGLALDLIGQRIMLLGPPGAGKTLTLIKLAAEATLAGRQVKILTTDLRSAGGVEQLTAFAKILELDVLITESPEELAEAASRVPARQLVLIDTPAANPRNEEDLDRLSALAKACPLEPILVIPAGLDPLETADTALAYGAVGATRMIITKLDATRRLGGILSALESSALALAGTTHGIDASDPIYPATAGELAEFLYAEGAMLSADLPPRPAAPETPAADHFDAEGGALPTSADETLPPPSALDSRKRAQLG